MILNCSMIVYFVCVQAAEDVNRGMLKASDKLYELKALKEQEKIPEVSSVCG